MPDDNQNPITGQQTQTGGNPPKDDTKSKVIIPDEVKEKYPDLVPMIMASESMDEEEQNYWFSVLPIMTPDQVAELRDILDTEKKRLAAIDQGKNPNTEVDLEKAEEERRKRQQERKQQEKIARAEDKDEAEDLLAELEEIA